MASLYLSSATVVLRRMAGLATPLVGGDHHKAGIRPNHIKMMTRGEIGHVGTGSQAIGA